MAGSRERLETNTWTLYPPLLPQLVGQAFNLVCPFCHYHWDQDKSKKLNEDIILYIRHYDLNMFVFDDPLIGLGCTGV